MNIIKFINPSKDSNGISQRDIADYRQFYQQIFMSHPSFPSNSSINESQVVPNFDGFVNTLRLIGTLNMMGVNSLSCLEMLQNPSLEIINQEEDSLAEYIRQQNQEVSSALKKKKHGCTCKKTNCSKMYCQCYANGKACTQHCLCVGCTNEQHENQKTCGFKPYTATKINFQIKKCNCRKSQCQKKYCECYSAGLPCNQYCRCIGCCNEPKTEQPPQRQPKPLLLSSFNSIKDLKIDFKWH